MNILEKIWIWISCDYIGHDEYEHAYYTSSSKDYLGRKRRYVIYKGIAEPSKVPPLWHAWLHHLTDEVPLLGKDENYKWQAGFVPNLTGTKIAYLPKGSKGKRDEVSADYNRWIPK